MLLLGQGLLGCGSWSWSRRSAGPAGLLGQTNREDPALSGNGRVLASLVERDGRPTVLLQEQPSGRELPLPQLRRLQPHRSPSLSWNGRYLALLVQQGSRQLAVIQDRATGQLHRLPLPGDQDPERLSLAPDGRRLALEVVRLGRSRVELLDLAPLLEPDLPATPVSGGGRLP
ncbi:MAG: Tol biopolymer transporter periplasmic protein [Cyanobacteriota bacterium]|nr:Tol biopolymer transporter periplasmic protein [Cyanobacteriota bacterium]